VEVGQAYDIMIMQWQLSGSNNISGWTSVN